MHEKSTCFGTVVLGPVSRGPFCLLLSIGLGLVLAPYKCPSACPPFLYSLIFVCFIICSFGLWLFYAGGTIHFTRKFQILSDKTYIWEMIPREVGETGKQPGQRLKQFTGKTSLEENWNWKLSDISISFFYLSLSPWRLKSKSKTRTWWHKMMKHDKKVKNLKIEERLEKIIKRCRGLDFLTITKKSHEQEDTYKRLKKSNDKRNGKISHLTFKITKQSKPQEKRIHQNLHIQNTTFIHYISCSSALTWGLW